MSKSLYVVAFTGHRPPKIGGYNASSPKRIAVKEAIKNALSRAVAKYGDANEVVVISGGALGVDTDAAREAHKMGLRFMVAAPCRNQDAKWVDPRSREQYAKMCAAASAELAVTLASDGETVEGGVVFVHDGPYNHRCMQDRNIWMVDHADAVVAIWDGGTIGGTANCVGYVRNQRKPMLVIDPTTL